MGPRRLPAVDGGALARLTVLDTDERPVALGDLWREEPAVVAWLRHFG
jgi:hypothetical protein